MQAVAQISPTTDLIHERDRQIGEERESGAVARIQQTGVKVLSCNVEYHLQIQNGDRGEAGRLELTEHAIRRRGRELASRKVAKILFEHQFWNYKKKQRIDLKKSKPE